MKFTLIILILLFSACSDRKIIKSNLNTNEATQAVALLKSHNLHAEKEVGKDNLWSVSVPLKEETQASALIQNTPIIHPSGIADCEPFNLEKRISETLMKMEGVVEADVVISPGNTKIPPRATVYIKHNGSLDNPNHPLVPLIKDFVSSASQVVSRDEVMIIGDRSSLIKAPDIILYPSPKNTVQSPTIQNTLPPENHQKKQSPAIYLLSFALLFLIWKFHKILWREGLNFFNSRPFR